MDLLARPGGVRRGRPPHPRAHSRGRGLPGQPLPGDVRAAAAAGRRRRRRPHRPARARQPGPVRRNDSAPRPRRRDRHRLARAVPAPRRPPHRVRPHQGHRTHRRGPAPQGPRRERDDRGPRPQRPRPGLRHRHRHRPRTVRRRGAPGPGPPRLHRQRRTRRRSRLAPSARGDLPARLRHRRPKVLRPADHPGPGDRPRGPYCGGIGWVDADRGTAELAVGIRTFWIDRAAPGGPASASAPAPGSPGAPTPTANGRKPNSRPPGCSG